MDKNYSVGIAITPMKDDDCFDDLDDAILDAVEKSVACTDVLAVWDNESGEVLHLVLDGQVFSK